jgi:hypothetical protein
MKEDTLKEGFERTDHGFRAGMERERVLDGKRRIDYTTKHNGRVVGVEAKGSRSNMYNTIGQLFFYKKNLSHIYILAPMSFIKKLAQTIQGTQLLEETGFLTVSEGRIITIKEPNVSEYYFYPTQIRKIKQTPKLQAIVNENDIEVIKKFKSRAFTAADLSTAFGFTRENAYRRIERLRKAGVVEQLDTGNPKTFRIIKHIDQPIFITNT